MRREYPEAPIVGVGGVVLKDDRVLLIRRAQEPLKGEWSLPGGALELGETLEQGIIREVQEETGLLIEVVSVVEVLDRIVMDGSEGGRQADSANPGRVRYHYVLVDYLCRVTGGDLEAASDAAEVRWVAREDLTSRGAYRLAPATVVVIEKAMEMSRVE